MNYVTRCNYHEGHTLQGIGILSADWTKLRLKDNIKIVPSLYAASPPVVVPFLKI